MLQAGSILDEKYKLVKPIGYGGMATIFLAQDISSNSYFAVKVMDKRLSHDQKFIQRFQQEAKIGIMLNHPNIPKVHYYGNYQGNYYIVMEYVKGISLRQYLKKNGAMQIVPAIKIILQTLNALSYAYKNGVKAHRDIKPDNIMLDATSHQVKVMDFGIAKTENSNLTHATMMFTTNYATPEQLLPTRFKEGVDRRTDIYTIGILLYELLTGKVPFQGESQIEVAQKQIKGQFIPVQSLFPTLPLELNDIIRKTLHPLPEHRYQGPEELAVDLKSLKCARPVSTHSIMEAESILPEKRKSNLLWIAVSASLALLLILGGGFYFAQRILRSAYVDINVETSPPGAQIFINGELDTRSVSPANLSLLEGKHNITVMRDGFQPQGRDIDVNRSNQSELQDIVFDLTPTSEQEALMDIGLLRVLSDPENAKIFVNNTYIGETPIDDYRFAPGNHSIYITKEGFFDSNPRSFNIRQSDPGEDPWKTSLHFLLVKIPPPPPTPTDPVPEPVYPGFLVVQTDPPHALVYIDGQFYDTSPLYVQLMPGTYTIRTSRTGYADLEETVSISSKEETQLNLILNPDIDPPVLMSPSNRMLGMNAPVFLKWSASQKADHYLVFITDSVTGSRIINMDGIKVNTNEYTIPSNYLVQERTYFWMVRAIRDPFSIPSKETWSFSIRKTEAPPPPPPPPRRTQITVRFVAVDSSGKTIDVPDYLLYINNISKGLLPHTEILDRDKDYVYYVTKDGQEVYRERIKYDQTASDHVTIFVPALR